MRAQDVVILVVLAVLWGGSYLFIRVAVPSFGPATLVAVRLALGAGLLWLYAAGTGRRVELHGRVGALLVLGALNAAVPYVLISSAELHLTASFAALLNATVPLFAAGFGALWLRERMTWLRAAGLLTGLAGVAVVVGWSPVGLGGRTWLAVAAMLVASACYAGSGVYARLRLREVPVHTLALGQQLGALAWLAVPGVALAPRSAPPAAAVGAVLALGVLSTALAYLLYFRLLARVGPTRTATVAYLFPVTGILWGALLLDEPITPGMLGGLALIFLGMLLINGGGAVLRVPGALRRWWSGAGARPPAAASR